MALLNLVKVTTATTGTGTITLGAAVSGFLTMAQAGAVNGTTYSYGIVDGTNSEVGTGVYTTTGTTLSRTVVNSTNANAAISLSGTAKVFITSLAADFNIFTLTTKGMVPPPTNALGYFLQDNGTWGIPSGPGVFAEEYPGYVPGPLAADITAKKFLNAEGFWVNPGIVPIVLTSDSSATTGAGQVYLNGATNNRIDFNTAGIAAPTITTRSAGTKIVFNPQVSGSSTDYALGMETNGLWYSVPGASASHKWYSAATAVMSLTDGNLTVSKKVNIVPGSVPGTLADGDIWTTSAGMYVRINGATVGPLGTGGGGGGGYTVTTKTAGYTETATTGDVIILANLAAGFTIVLPTAVGNTAKLTIKKMLAAGQIIIDGNGTQTIDGGLTATLTQQYEAITLVSDNSNWCII